MKLNKELVLEYMQSKIRDHGTLEPRSFTTSEISEMLDIQRSNASSLLNTLHKENRIQKIEGRPVRFALNNVMNVEVDESCFNKLVGFDGSLKNAVKLAKAAILYPAHSIPTLIVGPSGSGKSFFSFLMYEYAKENNIIAVDAPMIRFNCRNYDSKEEINDLIFGEVGIINRSSGGVLFIDHIDLLPSQSRDDLFALLSDDNKRLNQTILICATNEDIHESTMDIFTSKFPVKIDLWPLNEMFLSERFELIQFFLSQEATKMNRSIKINSELLRCILLYRCEHNIKQLKTDITIGCANAYVREFDNNANSLYIYMNEFPSYVRKGFLYYKDNREEIENLIPQDYSYTFLDENMKVVRDLSYQATKDGTIYDVIGGKITKLRERGMTEEDISIIVNTDLYSYFKLVEKSLIEGKVDKESISKVVDFRIIKMVEKFLQEASQHFGRVYPVATFYGLCLHISAAVDRKTVKQQLYNNQITEILNKYHDEYLFCQNFASAIEEEFEITLPIDEVIYIIMFISEKYQDTKDTKKPVVLIVAHGNSTATSIAEVVNNLGKANNTFAYDLPLKKDMQEAFEELKNLIIEISQGQGVLMLYDMGSFKSMADMLMQETGVCIRSIEIPATLIALNSSRKASTINSLDELYENIVESYQDYYVSVRNNYKKAENKKLIVTLCMSGEGGAIQLKNYLEETLDSDDISVVPLSISDRNIFLEKINRLRENHHILSVVGTYDPELYGIPFIPITKVFEIPKEKLGLLITTAEVQENSGVDFKMIYEYLSEQLEGFDIALFKSTLPKKLVQIKKISGGLSQDQELGLFLHIACNIHSKQSNQRMHINMRKNSIISKNKRLYNNLVDIMITLEGDFNVHFNDDDYADVIGIIRQL